jgi:DNA-binding PadR family transcriptional regulator
MVDDSEQSALTEGVFLILLSMLKPRHGYAVMQYVGRITKGRVVLGAGTLYGAINTILEKQWIRVASEATAADSDSRRKEYVITELGRKKLDRELRRLKELHTIGEEELEELEGGET